MKPKINNRGGVIFDWIIVIMSIFIVIVLWTVTNNVIRDDLYNAADDILTDTAPSQKSNLNWLITAWDAFPVIFIIGLLMYGIIRSQRSEYDTGWDGTLDF